jgi:hypothetical protein
MKFFDVLAATGVVCLAPLEKVMYTVVVLSEFVVQLVMPIIDNVLNPGGLPEIVFIALVLS